MVGAPSGSGAPNSPATLELLYVDRYDIGLAADFSWSKEPEKIIECSVVRVDDDLVVGTRPPPLGQGLAKPVNEALCECIERQRVESPSIFWMAAASHARCKIGGGVALVANSQYSPWRSSDTALKKVGGSLREKLGLAGARPGNDATVVGGTNDFKGVCFQRLHVDRLPLIWRDPAADECHG
jgi:hypothetical protein